MSRSGDRLYLCGTNAYNPRDYLLHAANMSVSGEPALGLGGPAQAECPFDPDDNSTAIWVERGNPSDAPALYTGTATDFNKADPLIFRTELYNQTSGQKIHEAKRTTKYDSKWLDSEYRPASGRQPLERLRSSTLTRPPQTNQHQPIRAQLRGLLRDRRLRLLLLPRERRRIHQLW